MKQESLPKICSLFTNDEDDVVAIAVAMQRRARDRENALLGEAAGQVQPTQNLQENVEVHITTNMIGKVIQECL